MDITICYQYFDNMLIVAYFLYKDSVYTEWTDMSVLSDNTILSYLKKDMAIYVVRTFFFFGFLNNFFFGLSTNICTETLFLFSFYNFQSPNNFPSGGVNCHLSVL